MSLARHAIGETAEKAREALNLSQETCPRRISVAAVISVLNVPATHEVAFLFANQEEKMGKMTFNAALTDIKPVDSASFTKARERLDSLVKPLGSLGKLEDAAAKLCAITGSLTPSIEKRCVIVFAADNGVYEEGVASAPQAVTAIQTINILNGATGVGVLAKHFNTGLVVADVGVDADLKHERLIVKKIRKSTGNIAKEPAMTKDEATLALDAGVEVLDMALAEGYQAVGLGEMGIGNTTTSSAVLSALLGLSGSDVDSVVGRGAGLSDEAFENKKRVIKEALALHKPDKNDPVGILQKVGGIDLAAMTGAYIGAAARGIPVVIDGFISAVAALCAARLAPASKEYMFASHSSYERGYSTAINELGLSACFDLSMRLGEGSGCPLMFAVMDGALEVLKNMATFDEAMIDNLYVSQMNLSF